MLDVLYFIFVFLFGVCIGVVGTLWAFARDPSVVRLRDGELVVKQTELDSLIAFVKKHKRRTSDDDEGQD